MNTPNALAFKNIFAPKQADRPMTPIDIVPQQGEDECSLENRKSTLLIEC